jgi:signal transduction histidine kinase/DNA-binding response OmpR family regulator
MARRMMARASWPALRVPRFSATSRTIVGGGLAIVIAVAATVSAVVVFALHATVSLEQLDAVTQASRDTVDAVGDAHDLLIAADQARHAWLLGGQAPALAKSRALATAARTAIDRVRRAADAAPALRPDSEAWADAAQTELAALRRTADLPQPGTPEAGAAVASGEEKLQAVDLVAARLVRAIQADAAVSIRRLRARASANGLGVLVTAMLAAGMLGTAVMGLLISRNRLLRMQDNARLQSERLASAVNHMRDGVAVFDSRDRLLLWNSAFFPATGFPAELAQPGTPFAAFARAALCWMPPFLSGARPPGRPRVTEARNGSRTLEVWRSTMPDGGQMIAVADITRRVETENIAAQAHKMEALGQLTGGVAHDFNNLLQVISANLELMGTRLAGDDWLSARLAAAQAGVARGAQLTRHLLAFARRQPLAPQAVDTTLLLTGMEEMLRRTLGQEIDVSVAIAGKPWAIRADPQQLENAVLNLAINGRDAMPGGGRLVIEARNAVLDDAYAEAHADVTPGQYVMIAVSDTGIGMTEAQVARAIEPFYTTKPEGRGTGLGLSMVYGFARQSGGHLKLTSAPGRGTVVRIYIPRTTSLPRPVTPVPETIEPACGETILLVEDDAGVRLAATHALRGLGYRVSEAESADAALVLLNKGERPDVLFTDVVMPGAVTARQLAARTRQMRPDVAVVFTSGYTDASATSPGRIDPGVMLVSKPWKIDDLARRLRTALADARGQRAAVPAQWRILLVEDDAPVRLTTADILSGMGHDIRQAASAKEGLAMLDGVDLLITDIGLPDCDGRAFAGQARQRRPELRVIVATGQDRDASDSTLVWLEKPFDAHALREAVGTAMLPPAAREPATVLRRGAGT